MPGQVRFVMEVSQFDQLKGVVSVEHILWWASVIARHGSRARLIMRDLLLLAFTLLMMTLGFVARADISAPNPDQPTTVKIDMWLEDINDINLSAGTFDITAQFAMRWRDQRLAFQSEGSGPHIWMGSRAEKQLQEIWHPIIDVNGEKGLSSAKVYFLSIWPDGNVELRQKFTTSPRFDGELLYFPFGKLDLSMSLVSVAMDSRQLRFELNQLVPKDDLVAVDNVLHGNWHPRKVTWGVGELRGFEHSDRVFPQIELSIVVQHDFHDGVQKILLPLIVIALVSWGLLWIDLTFQPAYTSPRIGGVTTLILTTIALKFVLGRELPVVHYFTLSDVLFNTTIIMLSINLLISCLIVGCLAESKVEIAKKINHLTKRYYAVLYLLFLMISIPLFVR